MKRAGLVGSIAAVGLACGCFIQPVGTTRVAYGQPAPQPSGPVMQAQVAPNAYPPAPQPVVLRPAPQPMPVMHPVGQVVVQPAPAAESGSVIQVVNGTGGQICYLYISAAGEDWGEDLLGDDTLEAGRSVTLSLGDASRWDLLAEDCGHAEITRYANRRLPSDGVWNLTDDGSGRVRSHGDEPAYVTSSSGDYGDDDDDEDEDQPSTSGGATADDSCRLCDISNGQVFSCGSWYQGDAVVYHDGAYRECDISNGQVFSCGSWYQGDAVVLKDGAYRECDISNGQVFSCGSWYQGDAVVCP